MVGQVIWARDDRTGKRIGFWRCILQDHNGKKWEWHDA